MSMCGGVCACVRVCMDRVAGILMWRPGTRLEPVSRRDYENPSCCWGNVRPERAGREGVAAQLDE